MDVVCTLGGDTAVTPQSQKMHKEGSSYSM